MRERTASDYENRIERVLRYIVDHLDDPLPLERLAAVAAFSPFHFHRIFRGITGESIGEVVRRLKLERAGTRLRECDVPVTEVALEAGYESPEAFARAFKRSAGVSPSRYRTAWPPPALGPRDSRVRYRPTDAFITLEPTHGGLPMDVSIENREALTYARIRHTGPYPEVGASFDRLSRWMGEAGLFGASTLCFTLSYDDPDSVPAGELRSDACFSLERPDVEPPQGIEIHTLPGSRYAVHLHRGTYDGIASTYRRMFGTWLPASGETVAPRPCMEIYLDDPSNTPEDALRTALCVPLVAPDEA